MTEFRPMPKISRLSREIVITEKLDGSNASVHVAPWLGQEATWVVDGLAISAGSRERWLTPKDDNYGFAMWVGKHVEELAKLGPGHHFGEWWGQGIYRAYDLAEKRFSLFNVGRWYKYGIPHFALRDIEETKSWQLAPDCCHVVPVLYRGPMGDAPIDILLDGLKARGSIAAPGFTDPEGIVIYHTAANKLFKKTIKGDEKGKSGEANVKKERLPRLKDPTRGGRRKGQDPLYNGPRRRSTDPL